MQHPVFTPLRVPYIQPKPLELRCRELGEEKRKTIKYQKRHSKEWKKKCFCEDIYPHFPFKKGTITYKNCLYIQERKKKKT